MKSLSSKIITHILIIVSFSLIMASSISFYKGKTRLVESRINNNKIETKIMASSIKFKINELKNDVQFLSSAPSIKGFVRARLNDNTDTEDLSSLAQWEDRLEIVFREMLFAKKHYRQIRFIGMTNNGRELLRVDRNKSVVARVKDKNLQEKGGEKYFKEAIKLGADDIYLSDFSLNRERGKITKPHEMMLRAAVPVYTNNKSLFGLIIINMSFNSIFEDFSNFTLEGTKYFVMNDSGRVLLHSDIDFNQVVENRIPRSFKEILPKLKGLRLENNNNILTLEVDNEIIVYNKIFFNLGNPKKTLELVLQTNKSVLLKSVYDDLFRDALFILCILIVNLALIYAYIKKVVKPISILKDIVEKFSKGESVSIDDHEIKSNDEIASLTKMLLKMSYDIKEANVALTFQKDALDKAAIVVEIDGDNKITYVNEKFTEISGYSDEEVIGKDYTEFNSGYKEFSYLEEIEKSIKYGRPWNGEVRNKNKSGEVYWVDKTMVPFKRENGDIEKIISIKKDITEKKMQEQKLIEATKAKSNFLSTMSHEIRTPLNGVLAMATIMNDEELSVESQKSLETMKECGDLLLAIVNDILDFSKIEAGKLTLEDTVFSPVEVVESTITMLESSAKNKGISIKFISKTGRESLISCDVTRFRQILTNLINNAIKFSSSGEIVIKMQSTCLENEITKIEVSVKDNGIGIDDSLIKHLFVPFAQGETSTLRKYGGTGLGLSICKKICLAMDGDISVNSVKGEGADFTFSIKGRSVESSRENEKVLTEAKKIDSNLSDKIPLKILVADDNNVNQQVAKIYLKKLGYTIDVVSDGDEVLSSLKIKDYDVIFMDSDMPNMDGHEATKNIRGNYKDEIKPWIIGFSANASEEEREKSKQSGMNDFVTKPVTVKSLELAIKRVTKIVDKNVEDTMDFPIDDIEILKELIKIFYSTKEKLINEIRNALNLQDSKLLKLHIHSLKGALCNFTSEPIIELFQKIEDEAELGNITLTEDSLEDLIDDMDNLFIRIESHLNK